MMPAAEARPLPRPPRLSRLSLLLLGGVLLLCAALGGVTWQALGCDRGDYLNRVSVSWLNAGDQYLFACGKVWHSLDAGRSWTALQSAGLPLLLREGRIAADRTAGRLYLAVILASHSTLHCPLCPLTRVEPAMFLSEDGGLHWLLTRRFPEGGSGITQFRAVYADPDYSDAAWAILVSGERVVYYATNTGGRLWRLTCVESPSYHCEPPDLFLQQRHVPRDGDEHTQIVP